MTRAIVDHGHNHNRNCDLQYLGQRYLDPHTWHNRVAQALLICCKMQQMQRSSFEFN